MATIKRLKYFYRKSNNCRFAAPQRVFKQINLDSFDFIKEDIQQKISKNFNNVNVEQVQIVETEDANTIRISITYSIPNTGINDELILDFS